MSDKLHEAISLPGQSEVFPAEGIGPDSEGLAERLATDMSALSRSALIGTEPSPASADVAEALLATFDGRLTAAERRMDRILAELGVE